MYNCEYCELSYERPEDLFDHIKEFHHKNIIGYCLLCHESFFDVESLDKHLKIHQKEIKAPKYPEPKEAKRNPVDYRYDVLAPEFLYLMAQIGKLGATKYGDLNWQKSRLDGEKGQINHIYHHLYQYRTNQPYDHEELGTDRIYHLAAIAFNAMMEAWYCMNMGKEKE